MIWRNVKRVAYVTGIIIVLWIVLSLVISSRGVKYTVAKTVEHDPSLPHFVLDSVVLHGETFGSPENPTVIVVHGGAGWDSLVGRLEAFEREVLFLAGSCNVILGAEIQAEQIKYFPNATLVLIEGVGHEMFAENPTASLAPVRTYLSGQNR